MNYSRNTIYSFLLIACTTGYIWLYLNLSNHYPEFNSVNVCLIKHTTGIACPSCGVTRSVSMLVHGNFSDALKINPIGYVVAFIMLLAPVWIIIDLATQRKTLIDFYNRFEVWIKQPRFAIPLVMLVICNWIWNITKGL